MELQQRECRSVIEKRTNFLWLWTYLVYVLQRMIGSSIELCCRAARCMRYVKTVTSGRANTSRIIKHFYGWRSSLYIEKLNEDGKRLSKLPKHLALVVAEDEINCRNVANIVLWSFLLGVKNITVCDKHGHLEQHCAEFEQLFKECQLRMLGSSDSRLKYTIHMGQFKEEISASYNVILSSLEHGRKCLVECFKTICALSLEKKIEMSKIDPTMVDHRMKALNGNLDDPDLLISFGDLRSFHGYQPWAVRLTEIISLKSHRTTSYLALLEAFEKFSRCEQRLGV